MTSPVSHTLNLLRRQAWLCAVVEKWIPKVKRRKDLFGFADVLAVSTADKAFLLIQATSDSNVSSRLKKAQARPELAAWLRAGGLFEVHGWSRCGGRWQGRRVSVRAEDLSAIPLTPSRRRKSRAKQRLLWDAGVCVFYLGDFHAARRRGWDQKPSQRLPPLTYRARSAATVAAPSSTQRLPDPFQRSPMILPPASVGPLPMSQPLGR